jgi:hypothetical protein
MLNSALFYADRGLPVFPLWSIVRYGDGKFGCRCCKLGCEDQGKHPHKLAKHGLKAATVNADLIKHWWTCAPDANIGIATSAALAVLDVDPRHRGDKTLADLERQHGQFPETWRVRTGSGGVHLYFQTDVELRNSTSKVGDGLDVRGAGGYAVAPPSIHISGQRYTWEIGPNAAPLAPMPAWLVAACRWQSSTNNNSKTPDWRAAIRDGVAEGGRNDAVTRIAGHLLRKCVDPLIVVDLMLAWNATRCRPPLSEAEVIKTVDSICACEIRRRGIAK